MRDEVLEQLCWNSYANVIGPVRGIIVRLHGLGAAGMKSAAEAVDLEWASRGGLVVEVFHNPWSWMNDATRDLVDAVVSGLRARHQLPADLPLIIIGGSMGGHAALTYCFTSRLRVTACQANCPVCDLPHHFTERPDLPRTLYSAYGLGDGIEARMAANSPLQQVARMPDITYQILHGGGDQAVNKERHSDRLVAAMRQRGLRVEYLEEPGMGHCGPLPTFALQRRLIDFVSQQLATS